MPQVRNITVQNNFNKGLITEVTGLTFPENACTDTDNCVFSRTGAVTRRRGIDYEVNRTLTLIDRDDVAISYFKWENAGGDGNTSVYVLQVGGTLHFYRISTATITDPLSDQKLASTVTLSTFVPSGGAADNAVECQYAAGNGYLFVFHPKLEPFYCTYVAGTITAVGIPIRIRDFQGVPETVEDNLRPSSLSAVHSYNLQNQGWSSGTWTANHTGTSATIATGSRTLTINTQTNTTSVTGGSIIQVRIGFPNQPPTYMIGSVTSYVTPFTSITLNVTSVSGPLVGFNMNVSSDVTSSLVSTGFIDTWKTAIGNYPSNSDVWWEFKNSSNIFDPATTINTVTLDQSPSPKGHYILSAFTQTRSAVSGVAGLTDITTFVRPRTGAWFQGRVWYSGVDASQAATGNAPNYTWTENIYFSQIVEKEDQFGKCYQVNDPTSESTFDLLPSDGGIVRIQGCGSIYKLFPIQNGLLVFAANGVWFITGNQGIGFTATDYTIVPVSSIQSISGTSFVNVQGYPLWWNEEGIYTVVPGQQGLEAKSLTDPTIASFYADIPLTCKKFARGDYNPLNTLVQWSFKSTEPTDVTTKYELDRVLNYNLNIQAFYPWSVTGTPKIHGVSYIAGPGGSTSPAPVFKYLTSATNGAGNYNFTFSEENDINYGDWDVFGAIVTYLSYFVTGYVVRGQAIRKFQQNYVELYSDCTDGDTSFKIRGVWDYATTVNSGQFSVLQTLDVFQTFSVTDDLYKYRPKRIKIRGHGKACQLQVLSNGNNPFHFIGWSVAETGNQWI